MRKREREGGRDEKEREGGMRKGGREGGVGPAAAGCRRFSFTPKALIPSPRFPGGKKVLCSHGTQPTPPKTLSSFSPSLSFSTRRHPLISSVNLSVPVSVVQYMIHVEAGVRDDWCRSEEEGVLCDGTPSSVK